MGGWGRKSGRGRSERGGSGEGKKTCALVGARADGRARGGWAGKNHMFGKENGGLQILSKMGGQAPRKGEDGRRSRGQSRGDGERGGGMRGRQTSAEEGGGAAKHLENAARCESR